MRILFTDYNYILQLTNTSGWLEISKQSMIDTCQTEIYRNASVRQVLIEKVKNAIAAAETDLQSGTTIMPQVEIMEIENLERTIKEIKQLACLNNCSGNGNCINGLFLVFSYNHDFSK